MSIGVCLIMVLRVVLVAVMCGNLGSVWFELDSHCLGVAIECWLIIIVE